MSTYYVAGVPYSSELCHHGIKGQRWGIRRFQNPDGSLTQAGKQRYSSKMPSSEALYKAMRDSGNRMSLTEDEERIFKTVIKNAAKKLSKDAEAYKLAQKKHLDADDAAQEYFIKNKKRLIKQSVSEEEIRELEKENGRDRSSGNVQRDIKWLAETKFRDSDHPIAVSNRKAYDEYRRLQHKYTDSCKAYTNKLLGEYGNKPVYDTSPDIIAAPALSDYIWEAVLQTYKSK